MSWYVLTPAPLYLPLISLLPLKASTAVIVANLAVLVPWTMRAFGHHEESEAPRSDRTPNSDGQGPAKDLTTLRFKHHTGPFVVNVHFPLRLAT